MTITVAWQNEDKTALTYAFGSKWNWVELSAEIKIADEMLDNVNHKVDVIVDFSQGGFFPANTLSNFANIVARVHPNWRSYILVGTNPFFRTLADTFRKISPKLAHSITIVKTMDEALEVVDSHERVESL